MKKKTANPARLVCMILTLALLVTLFPAHAQVEAATDVTPVSVVPRGVGGGNSPTVPTEPVLENASLNETEKAFNKNMGEDIRLTLKMGGYSFNGIRYNNIGLRQGVDYEVTGIEIVIKASFLTTLPVGKNVLSFDMSGGTDPQCFFSITNEPVPDGTIGRFDGITPGDYIAFDDVSGDRWYYEDVMFAATYGLMTGTSTKPPIFNPDITLTRGMVVTVLHRMMGSESADDIKNPFTDVSDWQWYTDAVKWATKNGIVSGYGKGLFGPDDNITREQLARILDRYEKYIEIIPESVNETPMFADEGSVSKWATDAVTNLTTQGIMNGKPGNLFDPKSIATRAEFAAVLHRYILAA